MDPIKKWVYLGVYTLCLGLLLMGIGASMGCAVVVDTSAAVPILNTRDQPAPYGFAGSGPVVRFALVAERQLSDAITGYCELSDTSNLGSGWPVNNEPEGYIHGIGCGVRIRIF
jgi:hypothetical protein